MRRMFKAVEIEKVLPILAIEQDCLISVYGDISLAFELVLPEIYTCSAADYEAIHGAFVKALSNLPPYTLMHKQDWFVAENYAPTYSTETSFLSRAFEQHFFERPFLNHRCFLYLSKYSPARAKVTSLMTTLSRGRLVPKESQDARANQDFMDKVYQFGQVLEATGLLRLRRLTAEDLLGTKGKSGLLQQYLSLCLDENPALQDIILENGLQIGAKHCQLYTISNLDDLPAEVGTDRRYEAFSTDKTRFPLSFASPLGLKLSCNHLYNQYIFVEDAKATLQLFEKKLKNLHALSAYSRENVINRDWTNQYLNEAHSFGRLPVRAHCHVLAWTEDPSELPNIRNQVATALAAMDCIPRYNTVDIAMFYWSAIPGNAADFPAEDTFYTFAEQAVCFLNLETNYRNSDSPFGIKLVDRLSGKPVHVDISDEPMKRGVITNRNKFILGPSGSGKSFFTNHLVRQYYEQGCHCVLVDVGNSYRGLSDLVGGVYFTYEESDPISFNPFRVSGTLSIEKKESLRALLLTLWKKDEESISRSEEVTISNGVDQYYEFLAQNRAIDPGFDSFYEFMEKEFKKSLTEQNVREKEFDLDNFLYVLKPYYRGGEFDYLLNSRKDLDLIESPLIVFELDNIKDHPILLPVVTLIIMETFISKMRRLKGIRKMILIEEAWKAMAKQGMAEYIKYLFKTVRKFFGEAIVVTQEVEDIISSEIVKQAQCYARQEIIRSSSLTIRELISTCTLREVTMTDDNPMGFLIENYKIISNRDLETRKRISD